MNMHSQISGLPKNRVYDEEEVKTRVETEDFCGARRHVNIGIPGIFTNFIALLGYSTMRMLWGLVSQKSFWQSILPMHTLLQL
jgi:hypothetical protein